MCAYTHTHNASVWESDDNCLSQFSLSFYHVGYSDQTLPVSLGGKYLYWPSHHSDLVKLIY